MTKLIKKKLMSKLIKASNEIHKLGREGKANYIHLSKEFIQKVARDNHVTFDEAYKIIEMRLNQNEDE